MRRGLLLGLGTYLIVVVIAGIGEAFRGGPASLATGAVMIVIAAPLSVVVIRRANAAPTGSWPQTIIGWLVGFIVVNAITAGLLTLLFGVVF